MKTWRKAIQVKGTTSAKVVGGRDLVLAATERGPAWLENGPRRGQWDGQGPEWAGPTGHGHELWEAVRRFLAGDDTIPVHILQSWLWQLGAE